MKQNSTIKDHFFKPFLATLLLLSCWACTTTPEKPDITSEEYKQAVSDFYLSLAAIQSDQALFAVEKMNKVAESFPAEPAAWANLSVFAVRQGDTDLAEKRMKKALDRAGENDDIQFLAGILESRSGNISSALKHLRKAAQLDTTNSQALFALAEELEREDPQGNGQKINQLLEQILELHPNNLAVLLEKVRAAAKLGNQSNINETLETLERLSSNWPEQIRRQFQEQKSAILEKSGENISFELAFLRNNLNQLPRFQHDLQQIQLPANQVGFLITKFLWLPNADHKAAPMDNNLTFAAEQEGEPRKVQLFQPVGISNNQQGSTITVSGDVATINQDLEIPFPAHKSSEPVSHNAVTNLDFNYDFRNDLAFAGPGGFKLYRQTEDSTFSDVTKSTQLPKTILTDSYFGVWANDLDLDGDMDLLLSARDGSSKVLRNNGDGTFETISYFEEAGNIRDFLWADFDRDGDPDAVLLTNDGSVLYYTNNRAGDFELDSSFTLTATNALDFGDLDGDGVFEVISWHSNRLGSTSFVDSTGSWQTETLVELGDSVSTMATGADPQLFISDLDNNAALDVMITGENTSYYWLSDENVSVGNTKGTINFHVYGLADMNNDMRLDLLGVRGQNQKATLINSGAKDYNARIIRPRASGPLGDQRINSFGIGGEIESRSGLQYNKLPIDKPWVHIGLGNYEEAEMLRIIWPNGSMQTEFAEIGYDTKIMNEQILKGSCPWILTYNGQEMEFVTDFLWRTALGLKINAQGEASVIHSIDWIKIEGDQLKPRNGFYDVRITADLWETHFFDHVSLMAVDRPKGTEVFVDERFALPAPEQKLYPMQEVYPIASAKNHLGKDVTEKVAAKDGNYVDSLPLTSYQGVTEEHYIEVGLGDEVPGNGEQKLIASGWIYPTDTSVNIALSQGDHEPPHGIRVEVPDGNGGWRIAHENIGFPAGKNKTILVDLENIFEPGTRRKLRLYTNMEIYWDHFQVGTLQQDSKIKTRKITADSALLRYRGFSKLEQKDRFRPTVPDYKQIAGTSPKWRDLVGFYTRFGEVGELTRNIDDRYVIMNAGDELVFKFPALDPPKEGWTRDFVLVGDGWVKDGDYNTGYSKTVLPLPYHGMEDYSQEPGLLQDDPVYQKHKKDWVEYHTRYVTPHNFNTALKLEKR